MKKLLSRILSNLRARLQLLQAAFLYRSLGPGLTAVMRDHGLYSDLAGDVEPLSFARAVFGPGAGIPKPPDFLKKLDSSASFTPAGYPGIYNSEPSVSSFLGQLVFYRKASVVVELGCFVGWTSAHLAFALQANGQGHVYCVDRDQQTLDVAQANLKRHGLEKLVTTLLGTSMDQAVVSALPKQIDILFIDTSHLYPDTLEEIHFYAPLMAENGCIVLHDSIWFPGVRRSIAEVAGKFRVLTFATEESNGVSVLLNQAWLKSSGVDPVG